MNELTKIIEKEKIVPTQADILMATFNPILESMKEYELKSREIKVTDISQVEEMKKARQLRLEISRKRIDADKKRRELKEDYLRGGRAIQSVYNIIEALATPLEKDLETKEKFAENIEKQKRLQLGIDRANLLSPFVLDISVYNLVDMSEAGFQELLKSSEFIFNQKKEAEEKAERERIAQEKKDKEENERIRIENIRLKKEADEREAKEKIEREKREAKEKADKVERDKLLQIEKDRANLADKLRKEMEEKILKEKQEAQKKIDKENEEKRQASLAPDKDKLNSIVIILNNIELPEVSDDKAKQIITNVKDLISKINIYILENTKNL